MLLIVISITALWGGFPHNTVRILFVVHDNDEWPLQIWIETEMQKKGLARIIPKPKVTFKW